MPDFMELYKQTFETWRFQINSYWSRNTYFAGFETAALGADWLLSAGHPWTATIGAAVAVFLSMIWMLNCFKQHEYIDFWWSKLIEFDRVHYAEWQTQKHPLGSPPFVSLASGFEEWRVARGHRPRVQYRYSMLVMLVPVLFAALWTYLVGYNLVALGFLHWHRWH